MLDKILSLLKIVFFLLIILVVESKSQFTRNFSIAGGLSTLHILYDNPATMPIVERDTNKADIVGGKFGGNHPGFSMLFNFGTDATSNFTFPVGFGYYYLAAGQKVPSPLDENFYFINTINILTFSLGCNYSFWEIPMARAKMFTGLEARGTYSSGSNLEVRIQTRSTQVDSSYIIDDKPPAIRFGAALKIGVVGDLWDQWQLNTGVSYSIMNLLGRDNQRGEFLTPMTFNEKSESLVHTILFYFLIQYKF